MDDQERYDMICKGDFAKLFDKLSVIDAAIRGNTGDVNKPGLLMKVDRLEHSEVPGLRERIDRLEHAEGMRSKLLWIIVTSTLLNLLSVGVRILFKI